VHDSNALADVQQHARMSPVAMSCWPAPVWTFQRRVRESAGDVELGANLFFEGSHAGSLAFGSTGDACRLLKVPPLLRPLASKMGTTAPVREERVRFCCSLSS
jgi:hypothetical protein